ncbi:MAG TPA: TetR/AcrR family transcriptional regulator [Xanthobacteraceae bacterium]
MNEPDSVPRRRDAAATRRKLLTAAREEFARSGFAGARVDEIAAKAGVNKQLVYHYFGDKDAMYFAVLEWIYAEIRDYERDLKLNGLSPDNIIRRLIESSFDYLALHPDLVALLNDENRNGAPHISSFRNLTPSNSPLLGVIKKALSHGVRNGIFRRGVNPEQLYISIAGLSYFYFSGMPTLSTVFRKDMATTAALRKRRKHIIDLVLQSLRP